MKGVSLGVIFLELLPAALLCALFAAVGIVHVTSRVIVVDIGYKLSRLEQEGRALDRERDQLKLELATLKSPARLEKIARERLGMVPPPAGTVITLSTQPAKAISRGRSQPSTVDRRPSTIINTADLP
jgi:cell division protein FtsL